MINQEPTQSIISSVEELNAKGCAVLIHEIVKSSLKEGISKQKAKLNLEWAECDPPSLKHFCDIYEFDYEKIKRAIIRRNKEVLHLM